MDELKKILIKGEALFNALSLRERLLVLVTVLVAIHLVWDGFFWQPLQQRQNDLRTQREAQSKEMVKLGQQIQVGLTQLKQDPDKEIKARLKALQARLKQQQEQAEELATTLISPGRMAGLLERMLNRESRLTLVTLNSLNSEPLFTPAKQQGKGVLQKGLVVYRHSFEVAFEGEFFAVLGYLEALRELPLRLFWSRVDYRVSQYPLAEVTLRLYTLSLSREWIGV